MSITIPELVALVSRLGYDLPDTMTEDDRPWMMELVNTCVECGHPARMGHCPSCFEFSVIQSYDEFDANPDASDLSEDDYGEESNP